MAIFTKREKDGIVIIDVSGPIVFGPDCVELHQFIEGLCNETCANIAFNMEKAHPLDSSAIGEIILGYSKLRECGKMLRLFSLTKHGEHILRLTQIDRIIKIHPNEQDALERFRK